MQTDVEIGSLQAMPLGPRRSEPETFGKNTINDAEVENAMAVQGTETEEEDNLSLEQQTYKSTNYYEMEMMKLWKGMRFY